METIFRLPASHDADLEQFRQETDRFQRGDLAAAEYRAFRVPRGVYEQRESGTYMLRVRVPAGIVLPEQMRAMARVSRRYGSGTLHVTTRQDIQVHRVLVGDLHPALVELAAAGLSTKGGGGNTVRNITGCPNAGVCAREVFDVSPHVVALTEFLVPDPLSYQLPRKYKIALSGCAGDCAGATVNDLGFIARRRGGAAGFAVYVGGGMGASSRVADLLEEFVPAEEIHFVAEAVKRVFDQHGNRRNRHKARLRFLIEQIGVERFKELYVKEKESLRRSAPQGAAARELPLAPRPAEGPAAAPSAGFEEWLDRCVEPQRQEGYHLVHVPLALGEIDADRMEQLADVVGRHGQRAATATQRQNFVLRWVHRAELPGLHAELRSLGLAGDAPPVLRDLVACTGASTCRLGICLSRGLAEAIREALGEGSTDWNGLGNLTIHVSGCPNACGRHPVADIGLFGAARRAHGRLAPHYVLQLGGRVAEGGTRLAEGDRAVPARNVPALIAELLDAFRRSAQCPDFVAFLAAGGRGIVEGLIEKHRRVPDFTEAPEYYIDWGAKEAFSLAGRGPGECGAGIFDLIEFDLANAREALREERLHDATVYAARALLVTRGQQASDAAEAIDLFVKHFLDEGLLDGAFVPLLVDARQFARRPPSAERFDPPKTEVGRLVEAVRALYDGMDASLRFKPAGQEAPAAAAPPAPAADKEADFRGVACPLNYVKTKLLLGQMPAGGTLSVLLDEAGARNVPPSVEKDGHEVLSIAEEDDHWRVVVRKR
jgi:sulfite reductase (ferredoxin)